MQRVYFEEFCRRVTEDAPYAVFHRENVNYVAHIHEEIEVGFVVSGSVRASGESCDYLLNEGDIYVFLPDEIHALTSESPNLLYILRLLPKQSDRVDFSSFRPASHCVRAGDAAYEPLRRAVLEMVDEHDRAREGRDMVLRKCRYEIFLAIYRLMEQIPLSEEERQRRAGRTSLLRRVNDYIAEHYDEPVSLDDLADHCGISKYYLSHSIKEVTGSTVLDFLMLYRLSLARSRLRNGEGTVTEIAFDCGFNNLRSFNRMFRKYYYVTPTEYRRNPTESLPPSGGK